MKEIYYVIADDGTKFDNRSDCIHYERQKALEKCKDDFQFFDYYKKPIPIEEATTEKVMYIVIKTDKCAKIIGDWFSEDGCIDPFDGFYEDVVGTWVYGEEIDKGDGWYKLELIIEELQNILNEINQ